MAIAVLAAVAFQKEASAQAPDEDRVMYTNACTFRQDGDTWGEGVILTRSATGYSFEFVDFGSIPHPPVPMKGQITGDKISFDFVIRDLPVQFIGTITPQEIRGRYTNDRNASFYNTDKVLLERHAFGVARGYCPAGGWRDR